MKNICVIGVGYVEVRPTYFASVVQMDGDSRMSFDARYWLNGDLLCHCHLLDSHRYGNRPQRNRLVVQATHT